ncbi:MAG: hypothetical protein AAGJ80_00640 [Cyanobacteria bacterium J06553_1]
MVTTTSIPSLFISHGAPDLPLSDCLARAFLSKSDTSGKAGGLMSVTASKADALPKVSDWES